MALHDYKCSNCGSIDEFPSLDIPPKCECGQEMQRIYAMPNVGWTGLPAKSGKRFRKSAYVTQGEKQRMASDEST